MKRLFGCGLLLALMMVVSAAMSKPAEARMQYFQQFKKQYDKVDAEATKCGICHGGDKGANKKQLSDYGKLLGEELGAKNVKGDDKLEKALKAIEDKGDVEGKKYGDLLKDGKLPPAFEE
ncbi:MAG: hypothetical protein KF774_11140 [Planctomyces sp.]|nr:hypothetical protein [Planctomyces sp.]